MSSGAGSTSKEAMSYELSVCVSPCVLRSCLGLTSCSLTCCAPWQRAVQTSHKQSAGSQQVGLIDRGIGKEGEASKAWLMACQTKCDDCSRWALAHCLVEVDSQQSVLSRQGLQLLPNAHLPPSRSSRPNTYPPSVCVTYPCPCSCRPRPSHAGPRCPQLQACRNMCPNSSSSDAGPVCALHDPLYPVHDHVPHHWQKSTGGLYVKWCRDQLEK